MENSNLLSNRYSIEELLGRGGMAFVYRARDLMLERTVALKVLRENFSEDPAFRERFRQEAKAAANLSHHNIVTVYDFGFDEEHLFIVMEYVPGIDLNTMIQQRGRLNIDRGVDLIVQACKGIGYAHRAGLVHCDVKPHNFIVTPDNLLKVTDFGIARALASIHPDEEAEVIWGSPQYFSPEQAAGHPPSPASDVYSLGAVMYYMFTGQLPFIAKTSQELARLHRRANPVPPRELNPFIPETLEKIILKVLSKEPAARYRTADQLGRVLQTFLSQYKQEVAQRMASQPRPASTEIPSRPLSGAQPRESSGPTRTAYSTERPSEPLPANSRPIEMEVEETPVDWIAVGLALLALVTVGGLIPFWMWVVFQFQ